MLAAQRPVNPTTPHPHYLCVGLGESVASGQYPRRTGLRGTPAHSGFWTRFNGEVRDTSGSPDSNGPLLVFASGRFQSRPKLDQYPSPDRSGRHIRCVVSWPRVGSPSTGRASRGRLLLSRPFGRAGDRSVTRPGHSSTSSGRGREGSACLLCSLRALGAVAVHTCCGRRGATFAFKEPVRDVHKGPPPPSITYGALRKRRCHALRVALWSCTSTVRWLRLWICATLAL